MPLEFATITFDLADQLGNDFDSRRTKVWITTDVDGDTIVDTDGNKIRLGSGNVTLNADGTGSLSVWKAGQTGLNPLEWQTTIHVDYPDRNTPRGRATRSFGPFTITASNDLADLVAEQEVPPTYVSTVTAQLDTKVTEAETAATAAATHRAAVENVVITDLGTTDGQTKTLIETDGTLTKAALSATIAGQVGVDDDPDDDSVPTWDAAAGRLRAKQGVRGQQIILRQSFPRPHIPGRVVWAAPRGTTSPTTANNRLYIVGNDKSLNISDDAGDTIIQKSAQTTYSFGYKDCFLRLDTGTLLTIDNTTGTPRILRSTNDGGAWSVVHTYRANTQPLGVQSWAYDKSTGHIYYGEYTIDATFSEIRVYRSTDDGQTFSVFHAFAGPAASQPNVRHVHGVQYDPIGQRVYVTTGDDANGAAGIYRVNAGGTALEPVITNSMVAATFPYQTRAIGLAFFPTHIAWGVDGDNPAYGNGIYRMPRSAIGTGGAAASVERVLDGTFGPCWWTICAADDYSKWLIATDFETVTERATNVYIVEDNGAKVSDGGAFPMEASLNTISPVGAAELHGQYFWLQTSGLGTVKRQKAWRGTLARSVRRLEATVEPVGLPTWQTQNSGYETLAASQAKVFGGARAPQTLKTFYLFDIGARRLSGTGTLTVQVVRMDTSAVILSTTVDSFRTAGGEEFPYWAKVTDIPANTRVEFRITETSGTATAEGIAVVTYGWGA